MYGNQWKWDGTSHSADQALIAYVLTEMTLGPTAGSVMLVVADFVEHRAGLGRPEQQGLAVAEGRCLMAGEEGIPQLQHVTCLFALTRRHPCLLAMNWIEKSNCLGSATYGVEEGLDVRSYCSLVPKGLVLCPREDCQTLVIVLA